MKSFASMHNGARLPLGEIPRLTVPVFRDEIITRVNEGARIACLSVFAMPPECTTSLLAVLAEKGTGHFSIACAAIGAAYPALTPECEQAHLFEREIHELHGMLPTGHPWLKPVRFPPPPRQAATTRPVCGCTDFFQVSGDEIHEVAVGPVHAGIIEPGHFRFQCHGETVYHLEISLGYQHRGIERCLTGGPDKRTIHYMETLAGDTTIGHATAYCRAIEALGNYRIPHRAQVIRGIALELERLANHIGDLGALAGDIGFLPTQSFCGRIRGDALNLTAALCGNRFGRGLVRPGGVAFDLPPAVIDTLRAELDRLEKDAASAIELLWNTPSVMARFEGTGTVDPETCRRIGLVGVAARACGVPLDVRNDLPYGVFQFSHIPVATYHSGDVFARAYVRWLEIQRSIVFIREQLNALPDEQVICPVLAPAPHSIAITATEGWRGEICHVALTGSDGRLSGYKIVDPSFHNWFGLACALRDQQISDFPLCNKSFNLSYCGHDL